MFNWVKTAMLMAAFTALFIVIGGMIGGSRGMMLALVIALGMNFFSYWFSDKMVLRMYNAQEVDENSAPQFYRMVRELATRANLPMPRVYLINEDAPNAFATGRNPEHAAAHSAHCQPFSFPAIARRIVSEVLCELAGFDGRSGTPIVSRGSGAVGSGGFCKV